MMRQMRENTKWIMMVTAIAFVGLMVFEWGMDITGQSGGGVGEIGKVNGAPVTYDRYQATQRNLSDQLQATQTEPLTSQQYRDLEQAAWDEVVNQILIEEELGRRGIVVTDDEVRQAARFSPPPELRQNPLFMVDGAFNLQAYQSFLATSADEALLFQLEAYYRDVIPRGKLMRQVTSGIFPSDAELWSHYQDANEMVTIRYVALDPATRIPDAQVEISIDELEDYYDAHRSDFQIPARAQIRAVLLSKTPTPADTAAALTLAQDIRQEIQDGADFGEVASRESTDAASAAQGGDLGTFARGQMVPAFDSVVFNARIGRTSEPIQTRFGFHIVEVMSRSGDTAQARHILVPIERTTDSELDLLGMADSLEALGEASGLDEAAGILGLEVATQELSEMFPFLAGAGQIGEGSDWVFRESAPGETSPVFETTQAFYSLEVVESEPAGYMSLQRATPSIEQLLRMEKKTARVTELGAALVDRARAEGTLDAIAGEEEEIEVRDAGPFSRVDFVPGLGRNNSAIGIAFGLDGEEISGVVSANNNAFIIQVVERTPADSTGWEEGKLAQRLQLANAVRQQRLQVWVMALRGIADIVDRREEVLRPSGQQQPGTSLPPVF